MQQTRMEGKPSPDEVAKRETSLSAGVEWPLTGMPSLPVDSPDFWSYSRTRPPSATPKADAPAAPKVAAPMRPRRKGFYRAGLLFMDGGPPDEHLSRGAELRTVDL